MIPPKHNLSRIELYLAAFFKSAVAASPSPPRREPSSASSSSRVSAAAGRRAALSSGTLLAKVLSGVRGWAGVETGEHSVPVHGY